MKLTLVATCMFGLEKQVGEEIDRLGLRRIETMDGRVTFEGEPQDVARANIGLRCAERVFIRLGQFPARNFAELFDGTKALPWEEWIGQNDAFPVKGHSIRSGLTSLPDCQSIVKKAVVERLKTCYRVDWFRETGVKYQIEFFIFKDVATLMIDTSGVALHKRGYRPAAGAAPLRETLAAAIALTARPREDTLLWDPFCGSGTIAIEAALIAKNRAPGLNRTFSAQKWDWLPSSAWVDAAGEAMDLEFDGDYDIWGGDIDPEAIRIARSNAVKADVEDLVRFEVADARTFSRSEPYGRIVSNPPYGERLMEKREAEDLYREFGRTVLGLPTGWKINILSSHTEFERTFGRTADRKRKLYNGMLKCDLFQYGGKKGKKG